MIGGRKEGKKKVGTLQPFPFQIKRQRTGHAPVRGDSSKK